MMNKTALIFNSIYADVEQLNAYKSWWWLRFSTQYKKQNSV